MMMMVVFLVYSIHFMRAYFFFQDLRFFFELNELRIGKV
jgi:hypothetical protein